MPHISCGSPEGICQPYLKNILCGTLLIWIHRYYLGMRCIYAYILLLVYVMQVRIYTFGYAVFIQVQYLHLCMLFSFEYAIYISVCSFYSGILLTFGMLFPSEYTIYISVCFFNLGILPCALESIHACVYMYID